MFKRKLYRHYTLFAALMSSFFPKTSVRLILSRMLYFEKAKPRPKCEKQPLELVIYYIYNRDNNIFFKGEIRMIQKAEFIHSPSVVQADDRAIVFRKSFKCKKVKSAKLEISAYGIYEATLNGERVGSFVLAPGWTSYFNRIQYQVYDITDMLTQNNVLDITVATGWTYNMGFRQTQERKSISVIAAVCIEYEDGTFEQINTDGSWEVVSSPVEYATLYNGERYNAACVEENYTETRGIHPHTGGFEKGSLRPQEGEQIVEHESYPVREIIHTPAGETVLDFGYNLVGYVEITLENAAAGDEISYTHAEILDKNGNFYTENLRAAQQRITYIARDGAQTYKPHFTFMGGRYVRLDKYPYEVKPENFRFIVVHSDIKRTGYFECSDERVNTLFDNIIRGQRGNYLDIPTDCPQRDERLGWTGDAQVFVRTAAYNFDVDKFFRKWLFDLMLDQRGDGSVPAVIPNLPGLSLHKSAAWQDAATVCPWEIYLAYADRELLERQFESMCRYVNFIDRFGGDKYMWNAPYGHFGDWLDWLSMSSSVTNDKRGGTGAPYIAQAYFAYSTRLVIKAGHILNKDVSYYEGLYDGIIKKFREHYMKDGTPIHKTQTACVLALHFDLCDIADRKPTADLLCELIHERGDTLSTGFVGTPYLLHSLSETGNNELAYTLLLQDKFPSWLYSVKMGATTIWEHWDGINENGDVWSPSMNSYNHYAYGAVADWMYGVCAGINTSEEKPGYEHIILKPMPSKQLSYVKASVDTRRGTVRSEWSISGDSVTYKFTVPSGSTADILLGDKIYNVAGGEYEYTEKL